MLVDAHQHFWRYSADAHGWIDESMAAIRRDFLPEQLEPLMRSEGIDATILVQVEQSMAETERLLAFADRHPFILAVVGWVDLRSPDVASELGRLAANPKFRGVRHVAQSEPDDRFLLRPDFQRGIAALAQFDLVYEILIYSRQLPAAIELARRFPEQAFVLDHLAKPEIRAARVEPWATHLRALARCENVSCKLSGLVTEADWRRWQPDDLAPYLDVAFSSFGPRRLLFGSDWPVCTLAADYPRVVAVARDAVRRLAPDAESDVMGENARRLYFRRSR